MGIIGGAVGAIIGALIGVGAALWAKMASVANVAVRPELAEVDFWTACFAGHGFDWLIYQDPLSWGLVIVLIPTTIFGVIGLIGSD